MGRKDRVLKQFLRTRFLFTMTTGESWTGVLLDVDERSLRLGEARLIGRDGTETPADGAIFLPRANLAYTQTAS